MIRGKRLGIVVFVFLMLLNIIAPAAWAQTPAPVAEPSGGQKTAAGFANVAYVPAKVVFCVGSSIAYAWTLFLSGGTAYNTATDVVRGGCGGQWVLRGEDMHFASSQVPAGAR